MIKFGCKIQVERHLKAIQNSVEYSEFFYNEIAMLAMRPGKLSMNTRTILHCFFFKVTELRMKNLTPGFADMSNSCHDLM